MTPDATPTPVPCGACAGACEGIVLRAAADGTVTPEGPCAPGVRWFAERLAPGLPAAAIDGTAISVGSALERAADLLAGSRAPLVYGLAGSSVEAARVAVGLADRLGAVVEPSGAVTDGAAGRAAQLRGSSTASLGEIRDRAQVVVVWREDPVATHPRLLARLRLDAATRAERGRTLVVVDDRDTATAREADVVLPVPAGDDLEALVRLRAALRGVPVADRPEVDGPIRELVQRLEDVPHAAILHGPGLGGGPGGYRRGLVLHELVRDLRETHVVTLLLRSALNAAGAEDVLTWQTGFPAAVDLASGHPRSVVGSTGAAARIASGDVDLVLSVAADPLAELPRDVAARLDGVPIVALDAVPTATTRAARVAFGTAAVGIGARGTVHRLDGVPLRMPASVDQGRGGDEALLRRLADLVEEREPAPTVTPLPIAPDGTPSQRAETCG